MPALHKRLDYASAHYTQTQAVCNRGGGGRGLTGAEILVPSISQTKIITIGLRYPPTLHLPFIYPPKGIHLPFKKCYNGECT